MNQPWCFPEPLWLCYGGLETPWRVHVAMSFFSFPFFEWFYIPFTLSPFFDPLISIKGVLSISTPFFAFLTLVIKGCEMRFNCKSLNTLLEQWTRYVIFQAPLYISYEGSEKSIEAHFTRGVFVFQFCGSSFFHFCTVFGLFYVDTVTWYIWLGIIMDVLNIYRVLTFFISVCSL